MPEVIFGEGKAKEHILGIARAMLKNKQQTVLITRLAEEAAEYIKAELPLKYNSITAWHASALSAKYQSRTARGA